MAVSNPGDWREVNFDGLVGPTHNYGGLSFGNVASASNRGRLSNPRRAALQGLAKMRRLVRLGLAQAVLPPHERPHGPTMRALGLGGGLDGQLARLADEPLLLNNLMSASAMWTANAATVAPGPDSGDGRAHLLPANLAGNWHRSLEARQTHRVLRAIFADERHFAVHAPLPPHAECGDEGAANHSRLCAGHGAPGLGLFVYGREAFERPRGRFPRRQTRQASQAVARIQGLDNCIFARQHSAAVDAGAFHNDVVAVANERVLLIHELALHDQRQVFDDIRRRCDFEPLFLVVADAELSLDDAVRSYLFNSQLLSLADGGMLLLTPGEAHQMPAARAVCERLVADADNPITEVVSMDLRESMRNGGGPACLRLRVVLDGAQRAALGGAVMMDEARLDALEALVRKHYRDRLAESELADPALARESMEALDAISQCLALGPIYDFQR